MLAVLLLAYAQQLLCDDTDFSATTQVQPGVPRQPVLLCPHHCSHAPARAKLPWKENHAVARLSVLCPLSCASSTRCAAPMCNFGTRCPRFILRMAERSSWSLCPFPAFGGLAAAMVVAKWAVGGDVC